MSVGKGVVPYVTYITFGDEIVVVSCFLAQLFFEVGELFLMFFQRSGLLFDTSQPFNAGSNILFNVQESIDLGL